MIIGNNNNNFSNNLNNHTNNNLINNNESHSQHNPFVENINSMQHSDPTSKETMRDKSLAMLQDRLENGTITLEEFNKKVSNLNKNK